MRRIRGNPKTRLAVGFVLRVVPVEEEDRTVILERQDMGRDSI